MLIDAAQGERGDIGIVVSESYQSRIRVASESHQSRIRVASEYEEGKADGGIFVDLLDNSAHTQMRFTGMLFRSLPQYDTSHSQIK
ncbi:MAG: hypothetical protein AB9882_09050 [Ignavibacteriaceae bacterium]